MKLSPIPYLTVSYLPAGKQVSDTNMKQNYNIQRNPAPISDAEIAKHQDFDALMEAFQAQEEAPPKRTARIRRLWVAGSAIAAALVGVIAFSLFYTSDSNTYEQAQLAYFDAQEYVQPPLKVKAAFTSYQIDANTGGSYNFGDATRIQVPSEAFESTNGEAITGAVNLYYREMHDYIDFFLSGIPMTYDSASVTYNLESAGMVEIYAEQNGQRVRMAKGKSIDIELASVIDVPDINIPPNYNIYKLDTAAQQWVYQEIDHIELLDQWEDLAANDPRKAAQDDYRNKLVQIENDKRTALSALESSVAKPIAPEQPRERDRSLQTFDLNFLEGSSVSSQAQKLRDKYKGAIWQVAKNSQRIPANADRIEWEDVRLAPLQAGQYALTLVATDRELDLIVEPAVKQVDYQEAMASYEAAMQIYKDAIAERETKIAAQRAAILQNATEIANTATTTFETQVQDNNTNVRPMKRKVVNKFKATSLGVWNCDRPIPPMEYEMEVQFVDANTKEIYENTTGYLVDKSRNTIYRFLVAENTRLKFNQQSENFLWLVTANNEIAVFRPEQFKTLDSKQTKHVFQLEKIKKGLKTESDVRAVLSI